MTLKENFIIFDLEVYRNFFSAVFMDFTTKKTYTFVIWKHRNDLKKMIRFIKGVKDHEFFLVGFNSISYDGQILERIRDKFMEFIHMSSDEITNDLKETSDTVIGYTDEERYLHLIPEWKQSLQHLCLLKINNYDNRAKRTSLKWLEFTMRFHNIDSLPIHHDSLIDTEEEVEAMLKYNLNDVEATHEFFTRVRFEIDLRLQLSQEFGLNLHNASEPRMAREILGKFLIDSLGIRRSELKDMRTYRNHLIGRDLIFDYVTFRDPVLIKVKQFLQNLEWNPYDTKENNYGLKKIEKIFKFHTISKMAVGVGGIHGCIRPGVYESSPEWFIHDWDVESYYPNLGIKNKVYPEHLSTVFCDVNEQLFNDRKKIDKKNPVNYIYKIILNSAYGLSMERNNYLHDPKYTFTITFNGQLLLLKAGEMLKEQIPGIVFYQFNTDGITMGYHPKYEAKVRAVFAKWEKVTKLKMEDKFYKKMIIKDVNNYIAVDDKDVIKRKGAAFIYSQKPEDKEVFYHKNPSALVVAKAVEAYFVHGIDYRTFIENHEDIFDFCLGVKVKRDFDLYQHGYQKSKSRIIKRRIDQKVVRYYVSHHPTAFKKVYKMHAKKAGQTVDLVSGTNQTYYNVHTPGVPIADYKIDYRYYIMRARKIVDAIDANRNQLDLFK